MKFNINATNEPAGGYIFRPSIIPDEEKTADKEAGRGQETGGKPWETYRKQRETEEETAEEMDGETEENENFPDDQDEKQPPYTRIAAGLASGGGYCLAVVLIMLHCPAVAWGCTLATATAVFIGADPLQLLELVTAKQTRYITAVNVLLWAGLLFLRDIRYIAVIITVSALSALVCKWLNSKWLYDERILNSPAVLHAVVRDKKNAAVTAWREHGKRETRAVLMQSKLDYSEPVVNRYGLACFVIGFYAAEKRFTKIRHELESIVEDLEGEQEKRLDMVFDLKDARTRAEEAEQRADVSNREARKAIERYNDIVKANMLLHEKITILTAQASKAEPKTAEAEPEEIETTAETVEEMQENAPLQAGIEAEAEAIRAEKAKKQAEEDEKTREYVERVREMLKQTDENGACIFGGPTGIAKHLGVSKYYANKYIALAQAETGAA